MGTPYLSEIRVFSFNFPPKGWAFCNGQFLPINQNQALFALLGTTYGGNGQTNFALPNLQSRVPIHAGNGHSLGESAGEVAHTLNISELPTHQHFGQGTTNNAAPVPAASNAIPTLGLNTYGDNGAASPTLPVALRPGTLANTGGSQPHFNMQPYLVLSFCIALQGIFPSQN